MRENVAGEVFLIHDCGLLGSRLSHLTDLTIESEHLTHPCTAGGPNRYFWSPVSSRLMPLKVISDDQILPAKPGPHGFKLKLGVGLFLPLALAQVCVGHPTGHFKSFIMLYRADRSHLRMRMPPGVDPFFSRT